MPSTYSLQYTHHTPYLYRTRSIYPDELEGPAESSDLDTEDIFNLTGEHVAGSACSEAANQGVSQVNRHESEFKYPHQHL